MTPELKAAVVFFLLASSIVLEQVLRRLWAIRELRRKMQLPPPPIDLPHIHTRRS